MLIINRLSLGIKLTLAPLLAIVSLVAVALLTAWLGVRLLDAQRLINEVSLPRMEQFQTLEGNIKGLQSMVMQSLSGEAMGQRADRIAELDQRIVSELDSFSKSLEQLSGVNGLSADQQNQLQRLSETFEAYKGTARETLDMKSAGVEQAGSYVPLLEGDYTEVATLLQAMVSAEKDVLAQRIANDRASAIASGGLLAMVALAAIVLSATLTWMTFKAIVVPMRTAADFARTVARGDLTKSMAVPSRDVIGALVTAMNDMRQRLLELVDKVRVSAENVANASTEIASGNADLSIRTEMQAASLEETSASMQHIVDATQRSAETAKDAARLAGSALGVANRGGVVVEQVVETMQRITNSSQKMAEIISVIDGISFQTNILALNAAVEAARAGEQGRGFAVVAGEVRSLAQRSAEAAKEIKTLIEASVNRISEGQALVETAGKTMNEIVSQVNQVSGMIREIDASSADQTSSALEINQAVVSLDTGTQQNAALVEQSAAASATLKQQSIELMTLVSVFRTA